MAERARMPVLATSRRGRWLVVGVLGAALLLRVGVVVSIRDGYAPLNDALHFDNIATSIANGDGYGDNALPPATGPGAFRSPLYPAVLAAVYVVAGDHSWTAGLLANAFIGTVAVAMIGLVASLLWGARTGFVALVLAAVSPTMMLVGSSLQLEPLLVVLSFGAIAAVLQHRRAPRGVWWLVAAGVLMGLAILTREVGFALVPCLAWLVWAARPPDAGRWSAAALKGPALLVLVAALTVSPWTIRNYAAYDSLVPVSSSSGFGLAGTFNDVARDNRGEWVQPYDVPRLAEIMAAVDDPDEAKIDEVLRDESIDYIKDHPLYVPELAFWGTVRLFNFDGGAYDRHIAGFVPYPIKLVWLSVVGTYVFLALAAWGAFSPLARRVPFALWAIPIFVYLGIALTLPANVRYRASIEPFTILLATCAVAPLVERWWTRQGQAGAEPEYTAST